jgi:uncharacterized membrane protein
MKLTGIPAEGINILRHGNAPARRGRMARKLQCLLAGLVGLLGGSAALGQSACTSPLTFAQVPDGPSPCTQGNRTNGINPGGDIVGRCKDAAGNPHSTFLGRNGSAPVLIDFSGAPFTVAQGSTTRSINAGGDIVGRYFDSAGHSHGYMRSKGVFSAIDVPFSGASDTDARGVNNAGDIVGQYATPGTAHGFLLSHGTFTSIDVPGAAATLPRSINDEGQMVGFYVVLTGPNSIALHGFLRSADGSVFKQIDDPGAVASGAAGINEPGEIVGAYTTNPVTIADLVGDDDIVQHGFLLSADGTTFTSFDYPGALLTAPRGGFSPQGRFVGMFNTGGVEHGFVAMKCH